MPQPVAHGPPLGLEQGFVLDRCRYFATVHLWPTEGEGMRPNAWLGNFTDGEIEHATYLLNAHLHFSSPILDRIFVEAVQGLSRYVTDPHGIAAAVRAEWETFMRAAVFVPVRGERPNPADSGALFVRRARNLLRIPEARLMEPGAALTAVAQDPTTPVIFVDDFLGTGSQFLHTWDSEQLGAGNSCTFARAAADGAGPFFYCPAVATTKGLGLLKTWASAVFVHPGHLLPERYGAFDPNSGMWPDHLRATAEDFLQTASARAGHSDNPNSTRYWKGYKSMGLAVSFAHGTPDATLPLMYQQTPAWTPLWTG